MLYIDGHLPAQRNMLPLDPAIIPKGHGIMSLGKSNLPQDPIDYAVHAFITNTSAGGGTRACLTVARQQEG